MEKFSQNPFLPQAQPSKPEQPLEYKPPRVDTKDRAKEIYVTTDVYAYLEDTKRTELCRDMFHCDKWKIEPVLLDELKRIPKKSKLDPHYRKDEATRNKLRGLIRAVSSFPPDRRSLSEMLHALGSDTLLHDPEWEQIEESLRNNEIGEHAEHAVELMEQRYNSLVERWRVLDDGPSKNALHDEIDRLRPLRDELYLRLVHPLWAKKMLFTETIDKRSAA